MTELPDAAARERALDLSHNVLVMAPAGSGKTGLLVQRLLRALATAEQPEQVVAITFTNKAAAEIRARVLEWLRAAAAGQPARDPFEAQALDAGRRLLAHDAARGWNLLEQPDRLRAQTIDSFCAQLAAQLPLLSGLGGPMRVSEDPQSLYLQAIEALFAELEDASLPEADRQALGEVLRLAGNRLDRLVRPLAELLARRDQWLRAVLEAGDGHWIDTQNAILSGLVEQGVSDLDRVLGADGKASLLRILREACSHEKLGWAADWNEWPAAGAGRCLDWCRIAALLVTAAGTLRKSGGINVKLGFPPKSPQTVAFKALLDGWADREDLPRACALLLQLPEARYPEDQTRLALALLRVMRRLAAHLRLAFGSRGETDFSEIAQSALAALRPEGGYGEALFAADARIRHLLVDEMQDTSSGQLELLRQLTQGWVVGPGGNDGRSLFLVGDPQQSIYAFRKAEVQLFLELWESRRLGHLPLTPLRLTANFRSAPAVVDWFNAGFTRIFPAEADASRGVVPFSPSVAMREHLPGCGVSLAAFAAEADEQAAQQAAEQAASLVADGTVVVLARARAHLEPVIRALRALDLTPVCQDVDPLMALPEVRDYLALVRALWHPGDRLSWAALLRAPFVGLCWADLVVLSRGHPRLPWPERIAARLDDAGLSADGRLRLSRLVEALRQSARMPSLRAHLADRAETLWHQLGGPGCVSRLALDDVRQAMRQVRAHCRGGGIDDLDALERGLAQLYAAPREGQVQLMTVHKAKGLEFDHVLLVGLHRKPRAEDKPLLQLSDLPGGELLVPKPADSWPEDHPGYRLFDYVHRLHVARRKAEALRLLYVAITRAKRTATLYACADCDDQGRPQFAGDSFAALLAPVISSGFQPLPRPASRVVLPLSPPPVAPRLSLDYRYEPETDLYRPQEIRTLKPSEAVLSAQEEPESKRLDGVDLADPYAQLVGILFHEAMQKIAQQGLAAWADAGASRRRSMAAGLRRRGLPEPQLASAVDRVLQLVARTLASPTGRWILADKPWARAEYALGGWHDGRWIAAVIDRCFEEPDGSLWVIDYKAAARPVAAGLLDDYLARCRQKYAAQITEYTRLLSALRPGPRVRGALYFPEADRLEVIEQG